MKDLFGNEIKEQYKKPIGKYEFYRQRFNYREGTKEQCCKVCKHSGRLVLYYSRKTSYKCELQGVANSENSSIRLKMVCDNFIKENSQ